MSVGIQQEEMDGVTAQVEKEIYEAEKFAEGSPYPDGTDCFTGLYATPIEEV